jgi:DNA (cytosine-5)-methyltransferase 1
VDDFAGPGGWDLGAALIGLDGIGYEWDQSACDTAIAAGFKREKTDVSTHDASKFCGKVKLYITSPPCTLFSTAGKGTGRDAIGVLATGIRRMFAGEDCREEIRETIYTDTTLPARIAENDTRKPDKQWTAEKVEKAARNDAFVASLVLEPARRILQINPERIAMEQVPAALPLWEVYGQELRKRGWSVWAGILCAADYGVPQTRYRTIFMGSRVSTVQPPVPTHAEHPQDADLFGDTCAKWVSMAEALPDLISVLPARGAGMRERHGERPAHQNDEPAPTVISKSRSWVVDRRTNSKAAGGGMAPTVTVPMSRPAPTLTGKSGTQWVLRMGNQNNACVRTADEPAPTVLFGHRSNSVKWYETRPATTIVGSFAPDIVSPPGYRTQTSRQNAEGGVQITVAEGGVLQSFPADYPWQGSRSKQFEQVGNAIPPLLAAHILAALVGVPLAVAA